MKFKKLRKPVTRKLWTIIRYLPPALRKKFIRSKFEICYDLSTDYVFKQAETENEVEQALRIVYDSYSHLGYIDESAEKVHFNAFLCLPTTPILIIKHKEEVIGTMSLVMDSPLGLPSEKTWDLSQIKSETLKIAEVSSLTIKRSHKTSRGHLLLTLCKFLYEYSVTTLHLDGVVMAATEEVEPFYTDVLLFRRVAKTGQEHSLVKGNKSTCCFLDFNKIRAQYIREYGWREQSRNLFYFFTGFESPNIQLPNKKMSLNGLLNKKNDSILKVLEKYPALKERFSPEDKKTLANLDPTASIEEAIDYDASQDPRQYPRIAIRHMSAHVVLAQTNKVQKALITDVSSKGLGLKFPERPEGLNLSEQCMIIINVGGNSYCITAEARRAVNQTFGFQVSEESQFEWQRVVGAIFHEVNVPIHYRRHSHHGIKTKSANLKPAMNW